MSSYSHGKHDKGGDRLDEVCVPDSGGQRVLTDCTVSHRRTSVLMREPGLNLLELVLFIFVYVTVGTR